MSTATSDPIRDRQLQILGDLAELGLEIARAVERRVREAEPETDVNALAMAYARVARAVRMSVLLQSRLMGEQQFRAASQAHAAQAERRDAAEARKDQAHRIVGRLVQEACGEDADGAERLIGEADERLEHDDIYGAVLERPVGELVAMICADLGVDPDWSAMAGEAWAVAEAGEAGSPFHTSSTVPDGGGGPRRGGGGVVSPFPTPPQSLRASSPARGGAGGQDAPPHLSG